VFTEHWFPAREARIATTAVGAPARVGIARPGARRSTQTEDDGSSCTEPLDLSVWSPQRTGHPHVRGDPMERDDYGPWDD
jgi:hypothetical protein